MQPLSSRAIGVLIGAALTWAGGFALSAQQPAQTPAVPGVGGGRGAAQPGRGARGGGQGGGSSADVLNGGPGADDPAYANYDFSKRDPVQPLSPEEELKKFVLPPGYRLEPVLSDPAIESPTAVAFDGNGRMFVLEDRGWMQDAEGRGEADPVGRISLHVDTNGDGVYDKHTNFVDHLVFPRFVLPFGANAILTKESHTQEVWKYTDTNGDGVADKKELFDTGYGRLANVQSEESFLRWGLDNWLYSAVNGFRARWTPHGVVKEPVGANGAQWGVSQDNDGKMWFTGGASGLPSYWQFPILYGTFGGGRTPSEATMDPDLGIPWGAPVRIADMQGGLSVTRMPDGSLRSTTAGAGGDVVRGDRMPPDLQGDYLYGEVVARIVRRVHPETGEGLTRIRNYYDGNEFIKSTDPLFRPVDEETAPDGTVYIVDMYRGIIQQATWTGPGTYLRNRIDQYGLDKVVHTGRIWRLVYDGVKHDRSDALARDPMVPRMNDETPAQLVTHLGHRNGWWRDTAQQLLVLKQDKSVVPALLTRLKTSRNLLERFHLLWTLEGLGALEPAIVRQQMEAPEPRMRIQAIRVSETLYKAGDKSFAGDYKRLTKDPDVNVVIQAMLTLNRWNVPGAADTIRELQAANHAKGVQFVATTVLNPPAAADGRGRRGEPAYAAEQQALIDRGGQIYNELCTTCHGPDGYGTPQPGAFGTMAPPLAGSPRVNGHRDYIVNAVLFGLSGPVDGRTYSNSMIPMRENTDDWVASVASYVRTHFGNDGTVVTPADVKQTRADALTRTTPWTVSELQAVLPTSLVSSSANWKLTASDNTQAAAAALSLSGWTSGRPQTAVMWFQIELPQPARLAEIQFDSVSLGGRGGRTGRAAGPPPEWGFPRGYTVEVSSDGVSWTRVATGRGEGQHTEISFAPATAKFIRLTQTATVDTAPPWSITHLQLFAR